MYCILRATQAKREIKSVETYTDHFKLNLCICTTPLLTLVGIMFSKKILVMLTIRFIALVILQVPGDPGLSSHRVAHTSAGDSVCWLDSRGLDSRPTPDSGKCIHLSELLLLG